jgi:hypothetical protein
MTLLQDVDAAAAAARPVPGAHSIWEIVLHLTGWVREVTRRLEGQAPQLPPGGDWPVVADTSPTAWESAVAALQAAHEDLGPVLLAFPEARLGDPVGTTHEPAVGSGVSFETMISGLLQHDAYHGGQIAQLKKAWAAGAG